MDMNRLNPIYNMNMKSLLNTFLKERANYEDDYVQAASAALKRAGFEKIILFKHEAQLVMINMNASISNIISGIVFDDKGQIERFQTSNDYKSVTVNALTRCLIMESIDNETDLILLRTLSKDKCSWVLHYITNETSKQEGYTGSNFPPYLCNAHTHGLAAFNHKDFQLVLDIGPSSSGYLLNALAERVRNGETFADGELVDGVYSNCQVKLAVATEGNREVYRVLIPDEEGRYPGDEGCNFPYSEQDRKLD